MLYVHLLVLLQENNSCNRKKIPHFDSKRQLNETSALEEMEIAENGPELAHAGNIIASAMDNYWKEKSSDGKWHFCHKTDDIRTYNKNSKVVQKFLTAKPKLAFMK